MAESSLMIKMINMNSSYNQLHYIMVESSYNHEYECVCVHSPSACCSVTCSVIIAIVRM